MVLILMRVCVCGSFAGGWQLALSAQEIEFRLWGFRFEADVKVELPADSTLIFTRLQASLGVLGSFSFTGDVSSTCLRFSGTRTDGDSGNSLFKALRELILTQIGAGVLLAEEALERFLSSSGITFPLVQFEYVDPRCSSAVGPMQAGSGVPEVTVEVVFATGTTVPFSFPCLAQLNNSSPLIRARWTMVKL